MVRTEEYFRQRAGRADRVQTLQILERAGKGNPPVEGDELPQDWSSGAELKKSTGKKKVPSTRGKRKLA